MAHSCGGQRFRSRTIISFSFNCESSFYSLGICSSIRDSFPVRYVTMHLGFNTDTKLSTKKVK